MSNTADCKVADGVCERHTANNPSCVMHTVETGHLTDAEREALADWQAPGNRLEATVERIIAARMAQAWREGAITALDFATRNEDGITLSLDLDAHPNPYGVRTPPARGAS